MESVFLGYGLEKCKINTQHQKFPSLWPRHCRNATTICLFFLTQRPDELLAGTMLSNPRQNVIISVTIRSLHFLLRASSSRTPVRSRWLLIPQRRRGSLHIINCHKITVPVRLTEMNELKTALFEFRVVRPFLCSYAGTERCAWI